MQKSHIFILDAERSIDSFINDNFLNLKGVHLRHYTSRILNPTSLNKTFQTLTKKDLVEMFLFTQNPTYNLQDLTEVDAFDLLYIFETNIDPLFYDMEVEFNQKTYESPLNFPIDSTMAVTCIEYGGNFKYLSKMILTNEPFRKELDRFFNRYLGQC